MNYYYRLSQTVHELVSKRNSTSAMITEMVEAIQSTTETDERKKQALNNLVIYSHQSGGRDVLLKGGRSLVNGITHSPGG